MIERRLAAGEEPCRGSAAEGREWAEAAHLFWPILAPIWMMLPSRLRRAGALSTLGCSPQLEAVCSGRRGASFYAQVGPQVLRKDSERRLTSRPAPSGAHPSHGWLRGHVGFGLNPLT
eukprot:207076-Prymnesium_polylepis.1